MRPKQATGAIFALCSRAIAKVAVRNCDEGRKLFLVVLELGADWPRALDFKGLTDLHVVAQQPQEKPGEFSRRVDSKLRRAQRDGGVIAVAVLVAGKSVDRLDILERGVIARALAGALTLSSGSELVLRGGRFSEDCCAHLVALAHVLEHELKGEVRISVQLELCGTAPARARTVSGPRRGF